MRRRSRKIIEQELVTVRERLKLYMEKEKYLLSEGGIESYSIGSRSLKRYSLELEDIQKMIEKLQKRERELEAELSGSSKRYAAGIVPQDW